MTVMDIHKSIEFYLPQYKIPGVSSHFFTVLQFAREELEKVFLHKIKNRRFFSKIKNKNELMTMSKYYYGQRLKFANI